MHPLADARAWLMGRSAALTVRYGDRLRHAGDDLDEPETVSIPTRRGTIPAELYRPATSERPPAVLVHLHGGAFVMRHPRMDDFWCRFVAATTGVAVLNVDYEVAPRHRYPVAHEQSHDAVAWAQQEGSSLGVDGSRLAVSGFSAGGNLAASACLRARDDGSFDARFQLLGVPSVDVSTADKRPVTGRSMITPGTIALVRKTYFRDAERRSEPYASPLLAPSHSCLPPAMVVTAERDTLRAEGDAYARALAEADVEVEHVVVRGRDHYFLDGRDAAHDRTVMDRMAAAVADHLR